jgi:hypothetical protein
MRVEPLLRVIMLFFLLSTGILSGCGKTPINTSVNFPDLPPLPKGAVVQENQGSVCFQNYSNTIEVTASIHPEGCFSSSCIRPIQQVGTFTLDSSQRRLLFQSRFVLIDRFGDNIHGCTADCGGGGRIEFDIGDLDRGTYSVWLGNLKLGDIEVPSRYSFQEGWICMSSKATVTPLPPLEPTLILTPTVYRTPYPPPTSQPMQSYP